MTRRHVDAPVFDRDVPLLGLIAKAGGNKGYDCMRYVVACYGIGKPNRRCGETICLAWRSTFWANMTLQAQT